jgi:hypothetical protein
VFSSRKIWQQLSDLTPLGLKRLLLRLLPTAWLSRLGGGPDSQRIRPPWTLSQESPARVAWRRLLGGRPHLQRLIIHLTDHCNLNCRACTHFSNIAQPSFADLEEFQRDLRRMRLLFSQLHELFLLGGEPLLHPQVGSFLSAARAMFPEASIKLMTNGLLLPRMEEAFWSAMAQNDILLEVDLYPVSLDKEEVVALAEDHHVRYQLEEQRGDVFFRLPLDATGTQDIQQSFTACEHAGIVCPLLRAGKLYPCAYPAYIDLFKTRFACAGFELMPDDYRNIYEVQNGWELFDFLSHPITWCRFCDFTNKESIVWEQASPKKAQAGDWLSPPRPEAGPKAAA